MNKNQTNFYAKKSEMLFPAESMDNPKYKLIFEEVLPRLAENDVELDMVLIEVARTLGTDQYTYLKEFLHHPEWPSPKQIIDKFEYLINKH